MLGVSLRCCSALQTFSNKAVLMRQPEVVQVKSKPLNIGQICFWSAIAMWVGAEMGAWRWLVEAPGGRVTGMLYILVMFGFAIRAIHDAGMYLFAAAEALKEK